MKPDDERNLSRIAGRRPVRAKRVDASDSTKKPVRANLLTFRGAESAHEKDNKAYQQNQAKPAAADDGTAKVKPAAAEQEKQNNHD
jgi:hypothetical protein